MGSVQFESRLSRNETRNDNNVAFMTETETQRVQRKNKELTTLIKQYLPEEAEALNLDAANGDL